ncbi:MAG: hypothetical protein HKM98_05245, partial [Gammaproteobacteria bacterium]|nr:hypothetical protein [Gammaproteobacteria bacterium]
MSKPISRYVRLWAACILLGLMQPVLTIAANDTVRVMQSRGVDQSVRYADLTKFGPWDDRNYQLTAPDLQLLAKNEEQLHAQIPAFFRVELRKEWPHLKRTGAAQYPRAARQLFEIRYGGFMRNGKIENDRRELARVPVPVGDQVPMNDLLGAAEVTIEINPSDPDLAIAGSNNSGGQEMYYSTDGGLNWTVQGVLPNTCCDPTVDWSSDGTVAYVGALSGGAIGVSAWRSFDGGQTWVDRDDLTTGGSDKEFIHVDKSPSSPYQDNVYMTYHNGNTMQFGRVSGFVDGVPTTNFEFDIQAFPGAPSGIGSDITTTPNGDIYYIYGAFNAQTIEVLKSTDGGDNFTSMPVVDNTNGSFDFPIPAMESRRAWIYVAADTDNNGNVYASWTDTVDPENDGSATANHTRIYVARSSDGGASWDLSTPHSTADMNTVDRFNQWMTVDENGVVHVVYYDTRNSVNRTGVDLYYTFTTSGDSDWENGTVDWNEPERISSETSPNMTDFFEFGDYNGISVVGSKVLPVWTDNRTGVSNPDVYAADVVNITAEPAFTLSASPASQQVCAPGDLADITVSVGSLLEFVNPVTLSLDLPSGFSGGISTNPVTPAADPNTTTVSVSVGTITGGPNSFDINGSASGADDKSVTVNVDVYDDVPAAVSLDLPADNASGVGTSPTLSWAAQSDALEYTVELDDDPNFGSIDFTTTTTATSVVVDSGLA